MNSCINIADWQRRIDTVTGTGLITSTPVIAVAEAICGLRVVVSPGPTARGNGRPLYPIFMLDLFHIRGNIMVVLYKLCRFEARFH